MGCELSHGGKSPAGGCSTLDSGCSSPSGGCTALDNIYSSLKNGCSSLAGGCATLSSERSAPGESPKGSSSLAEGAASDKCTSGRIVSW